jgi:hypothetical protein
MSLGEFRAAALSWAKIAAAAVVACYMAGVRDPWLLLDAGLAALLPLIYTALDPSDHRFGRKG